MTKNIGTLDKVIRIVLGAVMLAIGFPTKSWWGLVGLAPIVTALLNWCPLYMPFGIKTCRTEQARS